MKIQWFEQEVNSSAVTIYDNNVTLSMISYDGIIVKPEGNVKEYTLPLRKGVMLQSDGINWMVLLS